MTASLKLAASRNVAWAPTINLYYRGELLPTYGAAVKMQVRLYPGAPDPEIVTVDLIPFENLPPISVEPRCCLRLFPTIDRPTLAAFPTGQNQPEPGECDIFSWDAIITYSDGKQDKLALGNFFLEPGVTKS